MKIKYSHTDAPPQLVNGSNADSFHKHSILVSEKCSLYPDSSNYIFTVDNNIVAEYSPGSVVYNTPIIINYDANSAVYGHDNIEGSVMRFKDELVTYSYTFNRYISLINVANYIYGRTANITPTTETSLSSVTSSVTSGIVFFEDAFVESIDISYSIVTTSTYRAVIRYKFSGIIKFSLICNGQAGSSYSFRFIRPLSEILPGYPSGNMTPLHQFTIYNTNNSSSNVDTLSNISIRLHLRAAYLK